MSPAWVRDSWWSGWPLSSRVGSSAEWAAAVSSAQHHPEQRQTGPRDSAGNKHPFVEVSGGHRGMSDDISGTTGWSAESTAEPMSLIACAASS